MASLHRLSVPSSPAALHLNAPLREEVRSRSDLSLSFPPTLHVVSNRMRCNVKRLSVRRSRPCITMGIRAIESYDASFQLQPENEQLLCSLLGSGSFCEQVARESGLYTAEFTDLLFQPVPWSLNTTHGMPQEFEKYLEDKDNYVIINVPPNFMFQAKIFKPSRLCAVFKKSGSS